jgi:hypothetical protein
MVEQLRDFPNDDHDDGPDALEMAIRLAANMLDQPQEEVVGTLFDLVAGRITL